MSIPLWLDGMAWNKKVYILPVNTIQHRSIFTIVKSAPQHLTTSQGLFIFQFSVIRRFDFLALQYQNSIQDTAGVIFAFHICRDNQQEIFVINDIISETQGE